MTQFDTNIENTEIVENVEVEVKKFQVTPQQQRVLKVRISDVANNICHSDPQREQQDYAKLGRLQAMLMGHIEYDLGNIEIKSVPLREKRDEKTYTAFFYGDVSNMRDIKKVLNRSLMLEHFPHAMRVNHNDKNDPARRWSVANVTKTAAHKIVEMNPTLITMVTFSDEDRENSGVREPEA